MKIVVSFTTSPERIGKTYEMVKSILLQSRQPDLFILNIPTIFPRTNQRYIIPDFIKKYIIINEIKQDYGPATKLVPTIKYLNDKNYVLDSTYIIYIDDDIKYGKNMISAFHNAIINIGYPSVILGTGINILQHNHRIKMFSERKHNRFVSIAEGYGGVCVPLNIFQDDFMIYIHKYCVNQKNNICLLSDDIILSNYYNKKNVPIIVLNISNKHSVKELWENDCILEYGNKSDALHCGANNTSTTNVERYYRVLSILKNNNDLFIKTISCNQYLKRELELNYIF